MTDDAAVTRADIDAAVTRADADTDERTDAAVDVGALEERIAAWSAARDTRDQQARAPLWLTHHHEAQHDRCWRAGNTLVCRRCTLLWPLAFAVMFAASFGSWWPASADTWLLVVLPLPGVIEFALEHFGFVRYSQIRQLVLTVPVAIGVGRLLARYLDDYTDTLFWIVVWGYALVMFAAAVAGHRRARRTPTRGPKRFSG